MCYFVTVKRVNYSTIWQFFRIECFHGKSRFLSKISVVLLRCIGPKREHRNSGALFLALFLFCLTSVTPAYHSFAHRLSGEVGSKGGEAPAVQEEARRLCSQRSKSEARQCRDFGHRKSWHAERGQQLNKRHSVQGVTGSVTT